MSATAAVTTTTRTQARAAALAAARPSDLRDLTDLALVDLAVLPDRADARQEVLRRSLSSIYRASQRLCRQLAHFGRTEPCGPFRDDHGGTDDFAFVSTRVACSRRVMGASWWWQGDVPVAERRREPDGAPKACVALRYSRDRIGSLQGLVARDLRAAGRLTDARRQWNADRGLAQRAQLGSAQRRGLEAWLAEHQGVCNHLADALRLSDGVSVTVVLRWMNWLYDDACERSSSDGLDRERVMRGSGLAEKEVALVGNVIGLLGEPGQPLEAFRAQLDAAYGLTRPGRPTERAGESDQ